MFIEQIIEFKLSSLGFPGHTCNLRTGYFYDKTKTSKENKSLSELFLNIAEGNVPNFLHLDQVNYKIYPKNNRF